jgi:hypothetical protein
VIDRPTELSLEQEFRLKNFAYQVQQMSRKEAQEFLILLHQQMIVRETMYQEFLKQEWNLDSEKVSG